MVQTPNNMVFVFGSNEGGYHGAGAAKFALEHRGAVLYQAFGLMGTIEGKRSFAIPTKDKTIRHTLGLDVIQMYVDDFITFAKEHPELQFQVTRIGCGLAGLNDWDVAPMFDGAPDNCWFDEAWVNHVGIRPDRIWGTK